MRKKLDKIVGKIIKSVLEKSVKIGGYYGKKIYESFYCSNSKFVHYNWIINKSKCKYYK